VSSAWLTPCLRHCRFLMLVSVVCVGSLRCVAQVGGSLGSSSVASTAAPDSVSGQVVNAATGLPVARALVRFNSRAVLTDHDGNFQFQQNTDSSGNILVIKPGFYASADPSDTPNLYLQANQLAAPLRLLLYPEGLLTGNVAAPDGTPLPHIQVFARRSVYDESGHRVVTAGQTITDFHGSFRLPLQQGNYRIETQYTAQDLTTGLAIFPVLVPGESSSDTLDFVSLRSGQEQHFELRPNASPVHAVTLNMDQGGFGAVRLTARTRDGGILQLRSAFGRGSGETKVELPQGSFTLIAKRTTPEGPEVAEATVTVPNHDISGVVLRFSPTPTIPVEMVVDGASASDGSQPNLSQLNLTLQNDKPDLDPENTTVRLSAQSGQTFAFVPPPGSYHLQARSNGEWYIKSAGYGASDLLQDGVVVASGSAGMPIRVIVSNQTGALQGTVKLNGAPGACWVYLISTTPSAEPVTLLRSSADGTFTSSHLPPGGYEAIAFERKHSMNYRDQASLSPFSSRVQSVTISAGDKATVDLDAVPGAELVR
jgi:hypothetical protein